MNEDSRKKIIGHMRKISETISSMFLICDSLHRQRDFTAFANSFEEILQISPDSAEVLSFARSNVGSLKVMGKKVYSQNGQVQKAVQDFFEALSTECAAIWAVFRDSQA